MANPLRKTMVYLGLADEELEYEAEAAPAKSPSRPSRIRRPPRHSRRQAGRR